MTRQRPRSGLHALRHTVIANALGQCALTLPVGPQAQRVVRKDKQEPPFKALIEHRV